MRANVPQRIAVIGGGITGLAAAHRLLELARDAARPVEITLFEATPRIGGVFGTEEIDGYRLELGADMFITDKPWALDLCRRLGLEDQLTPPEPRYRKSLILCRGKPVPTPEAFNLMVPGRLWPMLTTPLLSPAGKLRLMCEPLIPRRRSGPDDESLASFVRRRLGREALDRIVQPLVGGIYTGDPERLSLQATLPRFQVMEREQGSLTRGMWRGRSRTPAGGETGQGVSGARYGLFVSLKLGMGTLQRALFDRLRQAAQIRLSTEVARVERATDGTNGYRVVTADSRAGFDDVILAAPAYRAGELIAGWHPELAGRLQAIEYASSAVVVSTHRLADISHPLDAYGLVIPARERQRILAVSFLSRKFPAHAPEGRAILRTFIGGALQPEMCQLSDAELLATTLASLRELLGVQGSPEITRVVRYDRAMPQYHVGHLERIDAIESLERSVAGLHLCGNAYRGVGLPDCIHSGEQAAERAFARRASQPG